MRLSALLAISALALSGCSSSNDSESTLDNQIAVAEMPNVEVVSDEMSNNDITSGQDPLVTNMTRIEFELMVPVYQSDALQLRFIWGEYDWTAQWVGDESWAASVELPINTEHLLSIVFYDNNGELELASFEQAYRTGSNALEIFQVTAAQFNSDQWDADEDGVSNLDELIVGTDPQVDDDSLLEVVDSESANIDVFGTFEDRIGTERPYSFSLNMPRPPAQEGSVPTGTTEIVTIDIDSDGNGNLSDFNQCCTAGRFNTIIETASRIRTSNSISWSSELDGTDPANFTRVLENSMSTVSLADENAPVYMSTEEYSTTNWESLDAFLVSKEFSLTGRKIENSNRCAIVAGTIQNISTISSPSFPESELHGRVRTIVISKEIGEEYWRVTKDINGELEDDYFSRTLSSNGEEATFQCEFVDFQ